MKRVFVWGIFLTLFFIPLAAMASDTEQFTYQASYRGVFSAGSVIPIADVVLKTQAVENDEDYLETELKVTSKPYDFVESLYPIRYRFRSWYWRDRTASLVSEYFEKGKSSKHKLIYLDDPEKDFVTHDVLEDGELDLEALHAGDYAAENGLSPVGELTGSTFDRLGLLQRVRYLNLQVGDEIKLPVTNGKELFHYRVKAEALENLQIQGQDYAALKLKFEGLERDEHDNDQHAHRPVFIWLSNDAERVPLQVVSRQALGKFFLKLSKPYTQKSIQIAQAGSR